MLQEGQIHFGSGICIDLEIGFHDDEFVWISCISSLPTILIAFIYKHGFIFKKSGVIKTHRLASRIYKELLEQSGDIEFYSLFLNTLRVHYLNQTHYCEVL